MKRLVEYQKEPINQIKTIALYTSAVNSILDQENRPDEICAFYFLDPNEEIPYFSTLIEEGYYCGKAKNINSVTIICHMYKDDLVFEKTDEDYEDDDGRRFDMNVKRRIANIVSYDDCILFDIDYKSSLIDQNTNEEDGYDRFLKKMCIVYPKKLNIKKIGE